jgi:preprotein translocase subunit YajC
MATGTFLAVFFIPLFYFVIYRLMERKKTWQTEAAEPAEAGSAKDH